MNKPIPQLSIPSAIIIGAVIIAVGLVIAFGDNTKNSASQQVADNRPSIQEAAKKLSIDRQALDTCIANEETRARVERDTENAAAVGANGTPTSIVIGPDGDTITIPGAQPLAAWDEIVDFALGDESFPQQEGDLSENVMPIDEADHVRGNNNAPVTIVEYSDIDCPFCHRLHPELKQLVEKRDDVRWVYRHLPITSLHPDAFKKSLAVECAYQLAGNDEEIFWSYLDALVGITTK